jgi:hypothetical protein
MLAMYAMLLLQMLTGKDYQGLDSHQSQRAAESDLA